MIKQWIESYEPKNVQETEQALREIMQEITLAGLHRANFFKHAAFYGGTALRIFHDLERFSEDLDFSLLEKNLEFKLEPYFNAVIEEFESLGLKVNLQHKTKSKSSSIDSAFLKSDTLWSELIFESSIPQIRLTTKPMIKIKIEVDTNPPLHFETEMHALLFRKWKDRVKGRDWYDLAWYIKNGVQLNLEHFSNRAIESGDWQDSTISRAQLIFLLDNKINSVDINKVKDDVIRFIPDQSELDIWSKEYFQALIRKLQCN